MLFIFSTSIIVLLFPFPQAAQDTAANDDDEVFKSLIELCEDAPKAVRSHIKAILAICLKVSR